MIQIWEYMKEGRLVRVLGKLPWGMQQEKWCRRGGWERSGRGHSKSKALGWSHMSGSVIAMDDYLSFPGWAFTSLQGVFILCIQLACMWDRGHYLSQCAPLASAAAGQWSNCGTLAAARLFIPRGFLFCFIFVFKRNPFREADLEIL